MKSDVYDFSVCSYIYRKYTLGKVFPPEIGGYYFYDRQKKEIVYIKELPINLHPLDTSFRDRFRFESYAYEKEAVKLSARRQKRGTRVPLKFEDIEKLIIKQVKKIVVEQIEEKEEEVAKEIVDTGAVVSKLPMEDYRSVDESKEIFRQNSKARTKYAWYENKITFERFVTIEFYKNDDYSTADIDWLGTKYRYLYMAFPKNGSPIDLLPPAQDKPVTKKKKDTEKSSIGTEKVAQSSQKITQGKITNSNSDLLPLPVCRRLWILRKESNTNWNWYMIGAGRNSNIYPAEDGKQGEGAMICKAFLKSQYDGLAEMCEGIDNENEVKHVVNGYFFER